MRDCELLRLLMIVAMSIAFTLIEVKLDVKMTIFPFDRIESECGI